MSVIRSAVIASVLTLDAGTAHAQAFCADAPSITTRLATEYGETPTVGGVDAAGRLLIMFANVETGTWTAVVIAAEGLSCIVSSGEGWTTSPTIAPAPKGQPS